MTLSALFASCMPNANSHRHFVLKKVYEMALNGNEVNMSKISLFYGKVRGEDSLHY
jgi:hypothetical protein